MDFDMLPVARALAWCCVAMGVVYGIIATRSIRRGEQATALGVFALAAVGVGAWVLLLVALADRAGP